MAILASLRGYAQTLSEEERAAVVVALKDYTLGIRTGRIAVDSVALARDTLTVYLNDGLNDIPIREDNCARIVSSVKSNLPERFRSRPLRVMVAQHEISTLIPRSLMPKERRRSAFTQTAGLPLVRRVAAPYTPTNGLAGRHIALWQSHGKYFEPAYNRWEWQRARLFGTVEDKFTQSFVLPYLIPMLEHAGAVVMTPRERDANPYEVIVDNDGQLAQSPYRETNGTQAWSGGDGEGFAYTHAVYTGFENPFKDGTYRVARTVKRAKEASMVTWTPRIPVERRYAVYVAYKTLPNSTEEALYTVYHKGGKTTFAVNQRMGGGTWIYLGTFAFAQGTEGRVELTNIGKDAQTVVTADAVRFGGGMGNIARAADPDSISAYTKGKGDAPLYARSEWQPRLDFQPETSGYPRYLEGARYYMQWAGIPDSVYSPSRGKNDYTDDFKSRGVWVNYLAGGTRACPDTRGLNIPIDLSFAFHTDAGTVRGDSIIGTLGIYQTSQYGGKYADGSSRDANRDLCDLVVSSIINDIRRSAEPRWTRRGMWNQRYYEAWTPRVPAMLLELMSHHNFADMRFGLDPRFRFMVSRAIYKGMLRYLSDAYGYDYVVQPLPVDGFSVLLDKKHRAVLSWRAVTDTIEPTAVPERYVVYKRIGSGDFDNGTVVKSTSFVCAIPADSVVSFKVTAVNRGGESFPSETLSVGIRNGSARQPVLIINGFDRVSAPDDFRSSDDELAGFLSDSDNGVPDGSMISYVGKMKEFRRAIPWTDDDASGFGDSYADQEKIVVAGNTFDYPALHGRSLLKAGFSFVSVSRSALSAEGGVLAAAAELSAVTPEGYSAIDLILGKQKQSKYGRPGIRPLQFKTFDEVTQALLTGFCRAGGRVFVSGAYVGTDLWQNPLTPTLASDRQFAENILKYKWRADRACATGEVAYVVSPLASERTHISYYHQPNEDSYAVESPDAIVPTDSAAYTAFRYPDSNMSAGIVFGGNATDRWRTVVLAIPFESLKGEAVRDRLMEQILRFLTE